MAEKMNTNITRFRSGKYLKLVAKNVKKYIILLDEQ